MPTNVGITTFSLAHFYFQNRAKGQKKWAKIFKRPDKYQANPNKSGPDPFFKVAKWAKKKRDC